MGSEAPSTALCLYKETRSDFEPHYPGSFVQVQLPNTNTFSRVTRVQHRISSRLSACRDEATFNNRSIAGSGSIYFCKSRSYPRSFIWRCLEEDHVLEFRSADLSKSDRDTREATVILRLVFPTAIKYDGVALADGLAQDLLNVFVLTKNNDLYTFTIPLEFFYRANASEDDVGRWSKIFKPASFTLSSPHRLFACSPLELVITLSDGRLMRLTRKPGDDGSTWTERTIGDGNWGSSLRGLIPWQGSNTVRYEGNVFDQATALAVASSPDGKHLLTVCLNHSLKGWNKEKGKLSFTRDLQDKRREPQEIVRFLLNPHSSAFLQVFEAPGAKDGDEYYLVTFSPHDSGTFKFWAIRDADHSELGVRDLFPENIFRIPEPEDGTLWSLADFKIKCAKGGHGMEIWVLLRLNRRYHLYHRKFDLFNLPEEWQHEWSILKIGTITKEPCDEVPKASDAENGDITEKWLDFIFFPGRLPEHVLETALFIYIKTQNLNASGNTNAPLKAQIASRVGSQVKPPKNEKGEINFTNFRSIIHEEWLNFWSIVNDLDESRWALLSLGYDEHEEIPWIVFADGCAVIRESSQIEQLVQNSPDDLLDHQDILGLPSIEDRPTRPIPTTPEEIAIVIEAAAQFRASFSESLALSCKNAIKAELWQEPSHSALERIQAFYSRCDFEEIRERQYDDLTNALADLGSSGGLSATVFETITNKLPHAMSMDASELRSTKFGLKLLVKGTQDMIALHTRILTDLLLVIVFIQMEVDPADVPMRRLDVAEVYVHLLEQLKPYQMMQWLASNTRTEQMTLEDARDTPTSTEPLASTMRTSTVLENLFAADPHPQSYARQSQSAAFTCNIEDLLQWIQGGNDTSISLDQVLVNIQCNLLKNKNVDLASSFLQFQPLTAWSAYVKSRLYLLRNEFTEAAICFKQAAYKLSRPPYPSISYTVASGNLLTPLEASFLSSGLANYYTHILSLFEHLHAYTHVLTFARLALQHLQPSTEQAEDHRADLLTRLFHAALSLEDWDAAYSALTRYSDKVLQYAALKSLITAMLAAGESEKLMSYPFLGLSSEVDTFLSDKTHNQGILDSSLAPTKTAPVQWYRILYAWRLRNGDLRGAAEVLVSRVEARKSDSGKQSRQRSKPRFLSTTTSHHTAAANDQQLLNEYLVAINALTMISGGGGKEEEEGQRGWVFIGGANNADGGVKKRKVVTLGDVRAEYSAELDRRSVLEAGRFGIVGGAGGGGGGGEMMDVDVDEDEEEGSTF